MRRLPDKYIAIGLFLLLLGLYLWRKDETIKYLMSGMFGIVCMALGDGLRRMQDSFKARLKDDGTTKHGSASKGRTDQPT